MDQIFDHDLIESAIMEEEEIANVSEQRLNLEDQEDGDIDVIDDLHDDDQIEQQKSKDEKNGNDNDYNVQCSPILMKQKQRKLFNTEEIKDKKQSMKNCINEQPEDDDDVTDNNSPTSHSSRSSSSLLLSTSPFTDNDDVIDDCEEDLIEEEIYDEDDDNLQKNCTSIKKSSTIINGKHSDLFEHCFSKPKKSLARKRTTNDENETPNNNSKTMTILEMIKMKKFKSQPQKDDDEANEDGCDHSETKIPTTTTIPSSTVTTTTTNGTFDSFPMITNAATYPGLSSLPIPGLGSHSHSQTHPLFHNNLLFTTYCQQQLLANARNALLTGSTSGSSGQTNANGTSPSSIMAAAATATALSNYMLQQQQTSSTNGNHHHHHHQLHPLNLTTAGHTAGPSLLTPMAPIPLQTLNLDHGTNGTQNSQTTLNIGRHCSSSTSSLIPTGPLSTLASSQMMSLSHSFPVQQNFSTNFNSKTIEKTPNNKSSDPDVNPTATTTTTTSNSNSTKPSSGTTSKTTTTTARSTVGNTNTATTNSSSASTSAPATNLLCVVCGDLSSGKHYGILACNGCSGFFKRSVRRKLIYRCQAGTGSCIIDKQHRNQCQACRLKKCISMGMNKDAVQNERQPRNTATIRPEVLLSDSNSERLLREGVAATVAAVFGSLSNCGATIRQGTNSSSSNQQNNSNNHHKSSNHHHSAAPSSADKHHHNKKLHNQTGNNNSSSLSTSLDNWSNAAAAAAAMATSFHHSGLGLLDGYNSTGLGLLDETQNTPLILNTESFYEISAGLLFAGVKWIKNLPSFATLTFRDQVILLEESWLDIFILNAIQWMMSFEHHQSLKYTTGNPTNHQVSLFSLNNIPNSGDYLPEIRVLNDMFERFRSMQVGPGEFACLKALALFKPEARGLKDVAKIEQIQDQIQTMLLQQVKNHPQQSPNHNSSSGPSSLNNGPTRFGKLLLLLLSLKILPSDKIAAIYFKKAIGNTTIEKLLCEMFKC